MNGSGPSSVPVSRWPRWKGILLVASLALNLLVVGMLATAGLRHGFRPPHSASQATIVAFARTLPPERKRMIWDATRAERRTLRPHWGELRRARAEVRDAMTTDPFDLARYKAAHQRLLDAEIRVRNAAHTFFEMVATQLTVDERRQFAQWQLQSERPRKKRGGKHDADSGTGDPASGDHDAHFAKEPAAPEKR